MKTRVIIILCAIAVSALSFTTINQDLRTATVTYDGYEYEEYNFSMAGE